ncbi:MAG TPA: SusD/RagB family nutrient-binding outer membrane lipoprotein [Puia sp.]|nr:SusD/RagB family nutrient-binding outer membrane lipoprotein [Puia sp.]
MKKISIIIITIALIGSGCGKSFLSELQNNPNSPTTSAATPQLVLPGTLTGIADIVNGYSVYQPQAVWIGYWNYSPGYSFNSTVQNYVMTSSYPQCWDNYYGVLANLNFIVQQTSSDPKLANYNAIANILEAICFKNLVDVYNDIPYSAALKAQANFYPTYDDASGIYDSLVVKLDNAMSAIQANLNNSDVTLPTTDDIMFAGNMQNWLQFANTVKLSMLVLQSSVAAKQAFLSSEAAKTASIGFISSNALVNPGYSTGQPSQMYGGFGLSPSGAINGEFTYLKANQATIDFYKLTNDPRLGYFCSANGVAPNDPAYFNVTLPINPANYGANYTGSQNSVPGGGSGIGSGLVSSPSQSEVMMTGAESYFLQAEATVYGWLNGGSTTSAQTLYQSGITSSFEFLNVGGGGAAADAAAASYYSQNIGFVAFPTGASPDSLDHTIIEQKWAALNGINVQVSYNDWRKTFNPALNTGYPIVPVSISPSNTQAHMPFRYYYPTEEANNNNESWTKAGGPNVDPFNNKIFWMP